MNSIPLDIRVKIGDYIRPHFIIPSEWEDKLCNPRFAEEYRSIGNPEMYFLKIEIAFDRYDKLNKLEKDKLINSLELAKLYFESSNTPSSLELDDIEFLAKLIYVFNDDYLLPEQKMVLAAAYSLKPILKEYYKLLSNLIDNNLNESILYIGTYYSTYRDYKLGILRYSTEYVYELGSVEAIEEFDRFIDDYKSKVYKPVYFIIDNIVKRGDFDILKYYTENHSGSICTEQLIKAILYGSDEFVLHLFNWSIPSCCDLYLLIEIL